MGKRQFTLIELLVVVAIIAILAAILLPALMRTKESARRAVCLGNMKQVGYALSMYADDRDNALPPGNATITPWHGIDSTYEVGKRPMGIAYLVDQNYIPGAEILYCPSWTHPYNQYDTVDTGNLDPWFGAGQMGGWPAPGKSGPSRHRLISYNYRSTFGASRNKNADTTMESPSTTAISADHFSRREVLWGKEYGHYDAYATVYMDGHSQIVEDPGASYMQTVQPHSHGDDIHKCNKYTNGSWSFQETIWQEFFDIK